MLTALAVTVLARGQVRDIVRLIERCPNWSDLTGSSFFPHRTLPPGTRKTMETVRETARQLAKYDNGHIESAMAAIERSHKLGTGLSCLLLNRLLFILPTADSDPRSLTLSFAEVTDGKADLCFPLKQDGTGELRLVGRPPTNTGGFIGFWPAREFRYFASRFPRRKV